MSTSEYNIKGTATMVSRDWIDERLGEGWFHSTAVAQHPDWPQRLLPGDYYPLRPQMHVWRQVLERVDGYESVEELVNQAAAATAEQDLNGIYKAFLWAASPPMFLRAVPRLWSSYVRFGELVNVENVQGLYRARIDGVPKDLIDWAAGAVAGFLRPALLLAGGKSPDSQVTDRRLLGVGNWQIDYQLKYE
ncbi:MAG: hypothetical protein R6X02_18415 [Enhygromyxa sp.]